MTALFFIVDTLLSLILFVFLLRLLLQWARADFRNPLAQAVVRITNPVVLPLRRILPPIGKLDTASAVAVLVVATVAVGISFAMREVFFPGPLTWLLAVALKIAQTILSAYFFAILLYAVLGMIAPGGYSPVQSLLTSLCEPVLRPFRRFIPSIADIDFSPLWALIAIQALQILLR